MEREERMELYIIPPNFAEEGTMFSGRIKTRNAIETGIMLTVLVPLLASLDVSVKGKIYIGMIILVPVAVLSVLGIQGESLFSFITGVFKFIRRRRNLGPPDERYRLTLNRKREKAWNGGVGNGRPGGRKAEKTGVETSVKRGTQGGKIRRQST